MRHFSPIAKKDFQTIRPFHESWQIKELKRHEFLLINLAPFSPAFISDTYDGGKYTIIKKKKKTIVVLILKFMKFFVFTCFT